MQRPGHGVYREKRTNCQAANQINQLIMRKQSQEPNVKCNSIRRSTATTTLSGLFVHSIKKTPENILK